MKNKIPGRFGLFLVMICGLGAFIASVASACEMPEGFHEYGTFGEKSVYLYHFPMFGSIHAYQVLVEADLSVEGKSVNDAFFAAKAANPGAIFVTSPAKASDGTPDYWVLPDYSVSGATFNARVHFRKAGKDNVLFDWVQVTVKNVLLKQLLKSTLVRSANLQYFYFGSADEGYLLHLASWDPDFDQILKVSPLSLIPTSTTGFRVLTFDGHPNSESNRLKTGDIAVATSIGSEPVSVNVLNEAFEFKIDIQR